MILAAEKTGRGELVARPRDGEETQHFLTRVTTGGWCAIRSTDASVDQILDTGPKLSPEQEQVLQQLNAGAKNRDEIAEALLIKPETARKRLERMAEKGLIRKQPDGRFELDDGPQSIGPMGVQAVQVSDLSGVSASQPGEPVLPSI
jgi:FixJ family two-component response regulator